MPLTSHQGESTPSRATRRRYSMPVGGRAMQWSPGKHPNSQKNLRSPWRKGQSGNPRGRPPGGSRKKLLALLDADLKAEAREIRKASAP